MFQEITVIRNLFFHTLLMFWFVQEYIFVQEFVQEYKCVQEFVQDYKFPKLSSTCSLQCSVYINVNKNKK